MQIGNAQRSAKLFLPKGQTQAPLWLLLHGTNNQVDEFLDYTGLPAFCKQHGIAYLAPQALPNQQKYGQTQFNVGLHSQPMAEEEQQGVHDVQYIREILQQIVALPCIDPQRIHCTGYSNGARFCMRLASEMSEVIASVAPVSGLRYPTPNHARRPIPILAFHGDADPVNPWSGNGAYYWHSSVPDAMQQWAIFNECGAMFAAPTFVEFAGGYSVAKYESCSDDASVELVRLHGAGHQWPDAVWSKANVGPVGRVDANALILNFFSKHRLPEKPKMQSLASTWATLAYAPFSSPLQLGPAVLALTFMLLLLWRKSRSSYSLIGQPLHDGIHDDDDDADEDGVIESQSDRNAWQLQLEAPQTCRGVRSLA